MIIEGILGGAADLLNKYAAYKAGGVTAKTFQWMEGRAVNVFTVNQSRKDSGAMASSFFSKSGGNSTALAKRDDKEVVGFIKGLEEGRKILDEVNKKLIDGALIPESSKMRSLTVRVLDAVMPRALRRYMPSVEKIIADEYDVLERVETLQRSNIDNIQGALGGLAASAIERRAAFEQLEADIRTAYAEDWDAKTLQEYIANRAGVTIYQEVAQLLDQEWGGLSPEQKEANRQDLLKKLEANLQLGIQFMDTMGFVCLAGLKVFHESVGEYNAYCEVLRPAAAIREAAKAMINTNAAALAGSKVLAATLQASIECIHVAVEGARLVQEHSVASKDMGKFLSDGSQSIRQKLDRLEEARKNRAQLSAPNVAKLRSLKAAEVVDVEAVGAEVPAAQ